MKRLFRFIVCCIIVSISFSDSTIKPSSNELSCWIPTSTILDLVNITQDADLFLGPDADTPIVSQATQNAWTTKMTRLYFSPWHIKASWFQTANMVALFKQFKNNPGFGENKLPRSSSWVSAFEKSADLPHFPNTNRRAITLVNTSLRLLPTHKPIFNDPTQPGEGYPFDNLQNSGIWANTPLFVIHATDRGDWVFVDSPIAVGWLPAAAIAYVDDDFVHRWETGQYLTPITDELLIRDAAGKFRCRAPLGSLLPLKKTEGIDSLLGWLCGLFTPPAPGYTTLLAVADVHQNAIIWEAKVSSADVTPMPLVMTPRNVARLANQMMGQTYGWGELYENRDCAMTLRDLMVPFGRYLPRNGNDQAKAGTYIPITDVSPDMKEAHIINVAVPFSTLVWFSGHIMLYIGQHDGHPLIYHNIWGLRTLSTDNVEGRWLIGKTVITTLSPGCESPLIKTPLLNRVSGITLLN